jgi:O-antigen/teichoic acid export membrane protein
MTSFQLLFTPQAARLFAREDYDGINHLYWQTAVWMAVIGFPLFAITFSLAQPLTLLLFGADYASSAPILALLSLAYYFSAALGFNGLTIRVFGSMRYLVAINLIAALVNLGVNLLLIPRYGAVGAAVGTCSTIVVHNILKQLGLRFVTKVNPFDWHYLRVFLPIVPGALGLLALQIAAPTHVFLSFTLAALISFAVFFLNRRLLDVANTFPELLRFPILRRFLT